jgi:hypothetical protein
MIAPIRLEDPETSENRRRLRLARQLVAATLLPEPHACGGPARPIPTWQAWLFVGWIVVATAAYVARMAGIY